MIMYLTNSGKQISKDSILAFVEENAADPKKYAITKGYLAYNDHNMRVRVIDLDLIPTIEQEEQPALPAVHKNRRHRVRKQTIYRAKIESLAHECLLNKWEYPKLVYELCKLIEDICYVQND